MVLKSSLLYSSYVKMGKTARAELAFSTKLHSLRFDFWQLESYRCGLRFLRTGCGRCGSWPSRYFVFHCQGGVWRCRQYVGNWELGAIQHLPSHLFEGRMRVFGLILKKGCRADPASGEKELVIPTTSQSWCLSLELTEINGWFPPRGMIEVSPFCSR